MEKETNKPTPPPLRASATGHLGLNVIGSATARLGPKPRPPFIDRNLKAGKLLLKGLQKLGGIGAIIEGLEKIWGLLGLKRQAAAGQP